MNYKLVICKYTLALSKSYAQATVDKSLIKRDLLPHHAVVV